MICAHRSPRQLDWVRIAKELLRDSEYGELANTLVRFENNFRRMDMLIQKIIEVTRTRLIVEGFEPISVRAVIDEALMSCPIWRDSRKCRFTSRSIPI